MSNQRQSSRHHRDIVGGMWELIGRHQLDFLVAQGLAPDMRLLDIGCGCLRGGVHFVRYLDPGQYYGVDADGALLEAGYGVELADAGLQQKLPREHLLLERRFDFSRFPCLFDIAIAQSVFTHLPINDIRLCLLRLAPRMIPGGKFFATFFECPPSRPLDSEIVHHPGGIVTFPDRDPFHYRLRDMEWAAAEGAWDVEYVGEWGHPRAQKMLIFHHISD